MAANFKALEVLTAIRAAKESGWKCVEFCGGLTLLQKDDTITIEILRQLGFNVECLNPNRDTKDYRVSWDN